MRDLMQCFVFDRQLHAVHREQGTVLLLEGVLRLPENTDECLLVELIQRDDDRYTADQLRDQSELHEILGHDIFEDLSDIFLLLGLAELRPETDGFRLHPALYDLIHSDERAAANEKDLRRVDLDHLLLGMLAASLRGNRCDRPLDDLEQRLLNALTGYVAGNGRIFGLSSDFVDLINIDDTLLRPLKVKIRSLDELEKNVLNILTDVTGLRECRRVRDRERDIQKPCERLRKKRLAGTGRSQHHDIGFLKLHIDLFRCEQSLIMIVDRNGEDLLCLLLTDDILIEKSLDLHRLFQVDPAIFLTGVRIVLFFFLYDLRADLNTLITDVYSCRSGDQLSHLIFRLSAEAAAYHFHSACHIISSSQNEVLKSDLMASDDYFAATHAEGIRGQNMSHFRKKTPAYFSGQESSGYIIDLLQRCRSGRKRPPPQRTSNCRDPYRSRSFRSAVQYSPRASHSVSF